MKKKEPRWHAARGIAAPNIYDSTSDAHFLAALRALVAA
jgi:hypothetical protein